jgi:leader peptidase (prepilin peptidase) / N-methyltransferase
MTSGAPAKPTELRPSRAARCALGAGLYALFAIPIFIVGGPPIPAGVLSASVVLAAFLVLLSVIDFEEYRLPDFLTLPLIGMGLGLSAYFGWDDPWLRIAAAVAGFATLYLVGWVYERIRGRAGMGLGDAKLLAASGAWLGAAGLPATLLYACLLGLAYAGALKMMSRDVALSSAIPFGPFLAAGTWLVWLYGPPL